MTITNDVFSLAIYALFITLMITHLVLSFRLALRHSWRRALMLLGGLSLLVSVGWYVLAVNIAFVNMLDAGNPDYPGDVYYITFAIPFYWNVAATFLSVPASEISRSIDHVSTIAAVFVLLFVVSLGVFGFARIIAYLGTRLQHSS